MTQETEQSTVVKSQKTFDSEALEVQNRSSFEETFNQLDASEMVSLALIDIDFFKNINDTYGHNIGDEVLASLQRTLVGSLPKECIVGRIGGDEYAILLPDMPAEGALIVLEEIRSHFASRPPTPSITHNVSISIGIATRPTHAKDFQELFKAADEALYGSKIQGRGFTRIYVESKMTLKSNYYSKPALDRLSKLSNSVDRTEASILREALDTILDKYSDKF